ncbi:nucleolar complex protein 4 homolog [Selaginella moellendorffii]|uniref:nucleolar complex protein 4 homolog n=1 Tax=Selaginella moellendorffii TaxID=88036 RepID=UPI000D1C7EE8|nr:nucleolar complex protein 4 homolog [Selaginella moellendorffii]|eukprot:XP_024539738.1 nucleolar complex protein 4 homolog [Selaginella moellendorffii]
MKVEEVRALGSALLVSRANVNNCSTLLSIVSAFCKRGAGSSSSVECVLEAVRCLQAFFLPILSSQGVLGKPQSDGDGSETAEAIYRAWLKDKFEELIELLIAIVAGTEEHRLENAALDSLMELLQAKDGRVDNGIYFKLCSALTRKSSENVFDALATEHCKDATLCFYTVKNFEKLVSARLQTSQRGVDATLSSDDDKSVSVDTFTRNVYGVISRLSPSVQEILSTNKKTTENALDKEFTINRFKSKIRNLWLNFLQLPLPLDVYKMVLANMSKVVFSIISNPIRLSDFLTKSYDLGGVYSVLALDSLHILMTKYGLEYPEFYERLYALLEPSMFFTKYRSRFFELLDSCLRSPLLPAYLAASFAKKLSRLSLHASPAGSLVVIAMVHNLLRRHPSINCLVHQSSRLRVASKGEEDVSDAKLGRDPYLANEKTSNCRALESSLWEIETLRRHYCPAVSRFVSTLEADLTVKRKTTEVQISDFCSGSYSTIFNEETKRRLKQVPLAYYKVVPNALFSNNEEFAGWSFPKEKKLKVM